MKFNEFLFGKKPKVKKASTISPEQQQLMSLINEGLTSGEGPFGEIFGNFDEEAFNKGVKNPALKDFQESILPQLQEKFIAGNQVLGSGMRRGQLKAGVDLQDKLAQLMYQAQQGQKQNKLSGLQTALGVKPFENIYQQGTKGTLQGAIEGFAEGAGKAAAGGGVAG